MKKWTTQEKKYIIEQIRQGKSIKDFIDELNEKFHHKRTISSIEHQLEREGLSTSPTKVAEKEILLDKKIKSLELENSILKNKYNTAIKNSNVQDNLIEVVKQNIQAFPVIPIPKLTVSKGDITKESMLLLLSDLHIGETVSSVEVNGINEYNINIMRHRLAFLADHILDIKTNKLMGYQFDKLVIGGLGDFVSGIIHQELVETGEGNVAEWTLGGAFVIAQFIREMSQAFNQVEFVGIIGNHGRLTMKPRFKQRYVNWDYFLYQILSLLLANQTNVKFHIPQSFWTLYEINGKNFLFLHGDNVNSYSGIPWYGIERTIAKLKELLESKDQKFDYICMGHFHNRNILDRVKGELIINGSLIGGNEFSIGKLFTSSLASQHLCGVHHKYGTSFSYKVRVQYAPTTGEPRYIYPTSGVIGDISKKILI